MTCAGRRLPLRSETWDSALRVEGLPRPAYAGTVRAFDVPGLAPATEYFFALRTADGQPNWSALSNGIQRSTPSIVISRLTTSSRPQGPQTVKWSPDGSTILTDADWEMRSSCTSSTWFRPAAGNT